MSTNFSVYTRDPIPNRSKPKGQKGGFETRRNGEESKLTRKIRDRLHELDPKGAKEARISRMGNAQKKKIARDQALSTLIDHTLLDQQRLIDNLVEWAVQHDELSEARARKIFESSLITTESNPSKSTFKIRIKI